MVEEEGAGGAVLVHHDGADVGLELLVLVAGVGLHCLHAEDDLLAVLGRHVSAPSVVRLKPLSPREAAECQALPAAGAGGRAPGRRFPDGKHDSGFMLAGYPGVPEQAFAAGDGCDTGSSLRRHNT